MREHKPGERLVGFAAAAILTISGLGVVAEAVVATSDNAAVQSTNVDNSDAPSTRLHTAIDWL